MQSLRWLMWPSMFLARSMTRRNHVDDASVVQSYDSMRWFELCIHMAEVTYDWYQRINQRTCMANDSKGKPHGRMSTARRSGPATPAKARVTVSCKRSAGKCGRMLESLEPLPLQWKGKLQRKKQSPLTVHVEETVSIEIISGLSCWSGIHRYRSAGYEWIWLHDCISRLESNSSLRVSADLLSSNSSSAVAKSLLVMFSFCRLGLKRKAMGRTANTFSILKPGSLIFSYLLIQMCPAPGVQL